MTDLRLILVLGLSLVAAACAAPARLSAVPEDHTTEAVIPGIPNARIWVDVDSAAFSRVALQSLEREKAYLAGLGHTGPLPPVDFLAVSGGGDNGAFGAGLLNGWKDRGNRPAFKAVTGVSTGALIAPLAFLGVDYDEALTRAYTTITKDDIFQERGLLTAVFSDALADTLPMSKLIERFVTQEMLDAIAEEHEKGRLLLVGTTNLDARRPIVWNMTAIAASRAPAALPLFRKILLASAAIPGAFPPVMIDVSVDGTPYQEMHVDGGAMAQVFLYPPAFNVASQAKALGAERERRLYIIRNARLDPEWADVERQTFSIASRAISSLIHSQGVGDLYRLYMTARRDDVDYNLAFIGADFDFERKGEFDPAYMKALYDYGYALGHDGDPWQKTPPGIDHGNPVPAPLLGTGSPSS